MIKKEHRLDTITWLIITVICTSVIAAYMLFSNINLKQQSYELNNKLKMDEYKIDSLNNVQDSLRVEIESLMDYYEESSKLYEDEISFLGHELDKRNIHPDYSNFGR